MTPHIDEGFDILGFRIQRKRKEGMQRRTLYTYPSKTALAAVKVKVRVPTQGNTDQNLSNLLQRVNRLVRGWANYFRRGGSDLQRLYASEWGERVRTRRATNGAPRFKGNAGGLRSPALGAHP